MRPSYSSDISEYLKNFKFFENNQSTLFSYDKSQRTNHNESKRTVTEEFEYNGKKYPKYINEFWTSKQRQASSIHEISYRACFKPQLPRFFIKLLSQKGDHIYDPFSGRGTTIIEAGLLGRNIISNDINPLSKILSYPRFFIPDPNSIEERLNQISISDQLTSSLDLSMFYDKKTLTEILSIRNYLKKRKETNQEDDIDRWIRMVATNRLTGHSSGFFSVYTLPPNQAVSQESQKKINEKRDQIPEYKDTRKIILKKSKDLLKRITKDQINNLRIAGEGSQYLTRDVRKTPEIKSNSVQLIVTSPPFLNVVQYDTDNWLRCWFNSIDSKEVGKKITMAKNIVEWNEVMGEAFREFFRIVKPGGWVAFEVGEVKSGKIRLDEYVIPLGINTGFECKGILINSQDFTKTSNIWGIKNMDRGTNTNRIIIFNKP